MKKAINKMTERRIPPLMCSHKLMTMNTYFCFGSMYSLGKETEIVKFNIIG